MKHLEILKEIEVKINEMCHEALKEGGIIMFNAVNQLSSAIGQMMAYKKPESQPEVKKEGD